MKYLIALVLSPLLACSAPTSAATFEAAFPSALALCLEDRFPDPSQQRPGVSLAAYKKELESKRREAEIVFDSPEGESYLEFELSDQVDDAGAACVSEMLSNVRRDES